MPGRRCLSGRPRSASRSLSPSNSTKKIDDKTRGYLAAGGVEVWIVRTVYGAAGMKSASDFVVDLEGLFDASRRRLRAASRADR
jgi:hypothetical protein